MRFENINMLPLPNETCRSFGVLYTNSCQISTRNIEVNTSFDMPSETSFGVLYTNYIFALG